ncbi:hypothetical protein EV648_107220 [Kribbella sp. VKM Ac-2568]|nr:hypothetical protein EV648_107220 [Kribbella sp. VKM Ac-2568]
MCSRFRPVRRYMGWGARPGVSAGGSPGESAGFPGMGAGFPGMRAGVSSGIGRGGTRSPLRDGASRAGVRQERSASLRDRNKFRLLTHPIPTREGRSYADPAEGSEPVRGGAFGGGCTDRQVVLGWSRRFQVWVARRGGMCSDYFRSVGTPAAPGMGFRPGGWWLCPIRGLVLAGCSTTGRSFDHWRLVRRQRPDNPSSGGRSPARVRRRHRCRAVVGTADTFLGV